MNTNEPSQRMPPNMMMRSFLVVGGGYFVSLSAFFGSILLLSWMFFPDSFDILMDQENVKIIMENTPELFFTKPFFFALLTTNAIVCFVVGFFAVRIATVAKFPHAVFTALVILISFLQQSIPQPQSVRWMFVVMMAVFPIALLLGAKIGLGNTRVDSATD